MCAYSIDDEAAIPSGTVRPTFTDRPVIRQSDEEGKVIFECKMVGSPKPDIRWFHNEVAVASSSKRHRMTLTEAENKLYFLVQLELSVVEPSDAGVYKVVASNSAGEGQATINLTFEEGSDLGNKLKIPDGIPPRFPKKPSIRQEGESLIMECLLEANPFPEITWFRGDKVRLSFEIHIFGKW